MMKNKMKHISLITILLIIGITLAYGIYQRSQPSAEVDKIDIEEAGQPKVEVEDIEKKSSITVPEIKKAESEEVEKENSQEKVTKVEVEKPIIPPKPELPKEEEDNAQEEKSQAVETYIKPIPKEEDIVREGDEEENPNPPKYEEPPKVEDKPTIKPDKDPVIVTPEVPEDTSEDKGNKLVPDSENPFLKPPSEVPTNGDRGGVNATDNSEYIPNTGDKF